jgi:hypothetical protein
MTVRDFFFQIFLFLAGGVLAVYAAMQPPGGERLKKLLRWLGIALMAVALVWAGYEWGHQTLQPAPGGLSTAPHTESSPNPASTLDPSASWTATLERRIPIPTWTLGTHRYTLNATCVGEQPGSVTLDFTVSDAYPIVPGDIYLRWGGLRKEKTYGAEVVDGINPAQPTVAVVTWDGIVESEAKWDATNCTGTVSWDNGTPLPLMGQAPFQH